MPKSRSPYPAEFRQQMVELVRSGHSPGALAKEFEPFLKSKPVHQNGDNSTDLVFT